MNPIQEEAKKLRDRGYAITWIQRGQKLPIGKGWQLRSKEPSDYRTGDSLGVLCGRLSDDLVCVDLDSPQALTLADDYLPKTGMTDGRPGKQRSHRYYKVMNIAPELSSTAAGGMGGPRIRHYTGAGIDLIGTGGQVVCPPSKHGSGEIREWQGSGEPATVDCTELYAAVERLAKVCGWRDRIEPARKELSKIKSVAGEGGHNSAFRAASLLVNDFDLPRDEAEQELAAWNETHATPKWGADDLAHKLDDAQAKRATNVAFPPGWRADDRPINHPGRLADEFLKFGTWRYWNNALYRYEGTHYQQIQDNEATAIVYTFLEKRFQSLFDWQKKKYAEDKSETDESKEIKKPRRMVATRNVVGEVIHAIKALTLVNGKIPLPSMLPDGEVLPFTAFQNGLLDLESRELLPHTPEWFSTVVVPYKYDPDAKEERLKGWLDAWFSRDLEAIALVQEWAGYILTRDTGLQHYLVLVGEGGNGKNTFLEMLVALLGAESVSRLPFEQFGERFKLVTTLGRLLNVSGDAQFSPKMEGVLKEYVGGTDVQFERKGKDTFEASPTARLVIACNEVPRVADRSEGIWRRMIVLPCVGKIPEGSKIFGMDRKEWYRDNANMAGILNWALAGLDRLRANGKHFTRPKVAVDAQKRLKGEHNPARLFLEDAVFPCPISDSLPSPELYALYSEWCATNGYTRLHLTHFHKEVRRLFPGASIEDKKKRVGSRVVRCWNGIQRIPENDGDGPMGEEVPLEVVFWLLHSRGAARLADWVARL